MTTISDLKNEIDLLNASVNSIIEKIDDNHLQLCQIVKKMHNETNNEKVKRIELVDKDIIDNMTKEEKDTYKDLNVDEKLNCLKTKRLQVFLVEENEKKKKKKEEENKKNEENNKKSTTSTAQKTTTSTTQKSTTSTAKKSTWTGYKKNNLFSKLIYN